MVAGYSGTPLIKKLGIRDGMTVTFVNPPSHYPKLLGKVPANVAEVPKGTVKFIHFFTQSSAELARQFPKLKKRLEKDGMLWVSWPKGSSKLKSDLKEDLIREIGIGNGLVDIKVCAVDVDWSALKFVYRVKDR